MHKQKQGFTLIEIAIVLVIIGLLAGGILKGQQMIENAKYKAWVKEIDSYRTAVMTFRDKYRYLPGDYPFPDKLNPPASFVPSPGNGNGIISGVSGGIMSSSNEAANALSQLILDGLITGDATNPDQTRTTPVGGKLDMMHTNGWGAGYGTANAPAFETKFFFTGIPLQHARRLDKELDDDNLLTGRIRAHGLGTIPSSDNMLISLWIPL